MTCEQGRKVLWCALWERTRRCRGWKIVFVICVFIMGCPLSLCRKRGGAETAQKQLLLFLLLPCKTREMLDINKWLIHTWLLMICMCTCVCVRTALLFGTHLFEALKLRREDTVTERQLVWWQSLPDLCRLCQIHTGREVEPSRWSSAKQVGSSQKHTAESQYNELTLQIHKRVFVNCVMQKKKSKRKKNEEQVIRCKRRVKAAGNRQKVAADENQPDSKHWVIYRILRAVNFQLYKLTIWHYSS